MQIFDETDIFSIILQYEKYIKRLEKLFYQMIYVLKFSSNVNSQVRLRLNSEFD